MSLSDLQNLIWSKLENKSVKKYSITLIFLLYLLFNVINDFRNNIKPQIPYYLLGTILFMSIGVFCSYVILEGLFHFRKQKNAFLTRSEIINTDYFTRVYILYYLAIIPIGFVKLFYVLIYF